MQLLVVVDVDGDDHHDRGGGDADEEGEVSDVNAPRHLVAHAGDDQPVGELLAVGVEAQQGDGGEQAHPSVVAPVADQRDAARPLQEHEIIADRGGHTSK